MNRLNIVLHSRMLSSTYLSAFYFSVPTIPATSPGFFIYGEQKKYQVGHTPFQGFIRGVIYYTIV